MLGIEREDPEGVAKALDRGFTMSGEALDALGERARCKILRDKTWTTEGSRIARFLEGVASSW